MATVTSWMMTQGVKFCLTFCSLSNAKEAPQLKEATELKPTWHLVEEVAGKTSDLEQMLPPSLQRSQLTWPLAANFAFDWHATSAAEHLAH